MGASLCGREKCAFRRKPYPPGIHGRSRGRRREVSEFARQLRAKQIVRFSYGVSESQFKNYVSRALAGSGADVTKKLVDALELRLDSVVLRLGFVRTRSLARQVVSHGHITVNGRRAFTPSYQTKVGQVIAIHPQSQGKGVFRDLEITLKKVETPPWLSLVPEKREGTVKSLPKVEDMVRLYDFKSIIEYYSR
ncbi:MAG: 30S ribosomal protein S4 [Candidatus Ryanbacteria bacterium]|nr:30S ribosomal protein S4 [Candidatus Ryanbacteria bacterium]